MFAFPTILFLICFFPGRLGCFLLWFFKDLRGWLCDEIVDNKLDIYYAAKQTILFNRIIVKYTKNLISTENNGASFLTVFKFIFPNYRCTSTAKFSSLSDILITSVVFKTHYWPCELPSFINRRTIMNFCAESKHS